MCPFMGHSIHERIYIMGFVNYRNGNYVVYFNTENGDKIRNTHDSVYRPAFAENSDVTITEYCDGGCSFCYAGCGLTGKHGDLNAKFFDTLHPYTELAINGNDLSHPDLEPFLERMRSQRVFVNMTVNQKHFEQHFERIQTMQSTGLIKGVGVSLNSTTDSLIEKLSRSRNTIVHVINGIWNKEDIDKLTGRDLDVLILGYKTTGRGNAYLQKHNAEIEANQRYLHDHMQDIFNGFRTVEFDNLALIQLDIQSFVSKEIWDRHYMGNDGDHTFFINVVGGYFAKNSTSNEHYPLMDNVNDMFKVVQTVK